MATAAVPPRDAATVILLRSAPPDSGPGGEPQVYLLRRVPAMPSAPGAYVFPGGAVDHGDAGEDVAWAGPDPARWDRRLGTEPARARALVCAAVRETFEESGVLLAGTGDGGAVPEVSGPAWEEDRRALVERSLPFAEFLHRRGLVLRSDLLRPWARWVTPRDRARRYDTRFFAAVLPAGQTPREVGGESDRAVWSAPAAAVAGWERGELSMLPPTVATLRELAGFGSVAEVMSASRSVAPIEPEVREIAGRMRVVVPDGTEYPLRREDGYA